MSYTSQTKYDEQLKSSINHFRIDDPMLPFIGEHYEKHRILLVSKSHYMPEKNNIELNESWYLSNEFEKDVKNNHCTGGVVECFKHQLFTNSQKELKVQSQALNFKLNSSFPIFI
jgi:hypothetical protein